MAVFTPLSYEYVFKIIKDRFTPPKEVTHQEVRDKYQLVKRWDRAGRMADTQEFANLVFEASRFSDELMEELEATCSSQPRSTDACSSSSIATSSGGCSHRTCI